MWFLIPIAAVLITVILAVRRLAGSTGRGEVADAAQRFRAALDAPHEKEKFTFSVPYRDEMDRTVTFLVSYGRESRLAMIHDDRRGIWWALHERFEPDAMAPDGLRRVFRAEGTFKRKRGRRLVFDELLARAESAAKPAAATDEASPAHPPSPCVDPFDPIPSDAPVPAAQA